MYDRLSDDQFLRMYIKDLVGYREMEKGARKQLYHDISWRFDQRDHGETSLAFMDMAREASGWGGLRSG